MIVTKEYDSVIIGAGAAGIAAACEVSQAGLKTALIEREECLGGILLQCIHNGFGLHRFKKELTGPEYAEEYIETLLKLPVDIYLETTVVDIKSKDKNKIITAYSAVHGVMELKSKTIVLAMGCRERNRGNIGIPGTRPSGVFTAGLAQRLLNIEGCIPGKKIVIVGSGDIGLIMARRLTWAGSKVLGVVEIQTYPSGLTRNIVQCLKDFDIPLYLNHSVAEIIGHNRVEAVKVSPLGREVFSKKQSFTIECDTVLLSVGLIPENELSRKAGIKINSNTNGPIVDYNLQTNVEGIFACGNVLHVHDLVDYVSEEAQLCGTKVVEYVNQKCKIPEYSLSIKTGSNLKYVLPNQWSSGQDIRFLMRSIVVAQKGELILKQGQSIILRKKLNFIHPAEMISFNLKLSDVPKIKPDIPIEFSIYIEDLL